MDDIFKYKDSERSEFDPCTFDERDQVEMLRGNIPYGDCPYCKAEDAMIYEGEVCFVCKNCHRSAHEDAYYLWLLGYKIKFDKRDDMTMVFL